METYSMNEVFTAYENGIKEGKKKLAIELSKLAENKLSYSADYEGCRDFTLEVIGIIRQTLRDNID